RLNHKNNLYDSSPVGDLILDEHGLILEANQQAGRILGAKHSACDQFPFLNYLDPDSRVRFLDYLRGLKTTLNPVSIELELRLPANRRHLVELIAAPLKRVGSPRVTQFRVILIDITTRDAAREALGTVQQNYRALIDSIQGIVWEADPRTLEILFVS